MTDNQTELQKWLDFVIAARKRGPVFVNSTAVHSIRLAVAKVVPNNMAYLIMNDINYFIDFLKVTIEHDSK